MGQPGLVILFGSGETSASGRKVYEWLFRRLPPPLRVAVLETPAGFQPNSAAVAEEVAEFICHRLQNFTPEVTVVPARRRGTPFSPENPDIVAPLLTANAVFLGPGSPTYAVRQLRDSLAWHTLVARHRLGAAVILSSAATIAAGAHALPVYEIYKVGEDLHWAPGLDLLGPYGLALVPVPHWDNAEGGSALDTSHCFMGQARFDALQALLPAGMTVVGIDEHTALILDVAEGRGRVMGRGGVTWRRGDEEMRYVAGDSVALGDWCDYRVPAAEAGILPAVWQRVLAAAAETPDSPPEPPAEVLRLAEERRVARERRDWATADRLRAAVQALGWQIEDMPEGVRLIQNE